MQQEIATPRSPDRPATHQSRQNLLADLLANLADPPISDRRFWRIQAWVVLVLVLHLGAYLANERGANTTPGFVWNLLLLVPVVYGGTVFGLVGSLGAALTGIVVLVPEELLTHHSSTSLWGGWSILVTVLVVAVLIGYRFEVERREREQLLAAERARVEAETRVDMVEAASSEELATSAQRFRLAFENNTAGMAIADLRGNLVDVNRSYCEMLGYTPEELLGQDLMEVTHPEDRLLTAEMNRRLTSGAVDHVRYVTRFVH